MNQNAQCCILLFHVTVVGAASFAHAHFERMSAGSNFTIACDDGANVVHWGGRDLAEKVLNSDEICEFP